MILIGARRVLMVGLAVSSIAVFLMTRFSLDMTSNSIMVSGVIQGFGTGMMFAPLSILAFATLSPAHRVEGTILNTMARSLGSSVGISAAQALLVRQSASVHSVLAGNIQTSDPMIAAALPPFLNPTTQTGMMALNGELSRQGAMVAYDTVFSTLLVASTIIVPLLLIMRSPPPVAQPAHEMVGE
jgi:MFS transporter, DHA2 family, multidrug resistance protein